MELTKRILKITGIIITLGFLLTLFILTCIDDNDASNDNNSNHNNYEGYQLFEIDWIENNKDYGDINVYIDWTYLNQQGHPNYSYEIINYNDNYKYYTSYDTTDDKYFSEFTDWKLEQQPITIDINPVTLVPLPSYVDKNSNGLFESSEELPVDYFIINYNTKKVKFNGEEIFPSDEVNVL